MEKVKKVTLSGILFAIGLILPFFFGQIPAVGKMLLPMHIPVLICGLILGWQYGRAAPISWRERTPAMNGWKHTTI